MNMKSGQEPIYLQLAVTTNAIVLQKLVEAKLKRVYAEGSAAREAGQDPLQSAAEDSPAADAPCNGSRVLDEASAARADANMAALLAEVDLEGEG